MDENVTTWRRLWILGLVIPALVLWQSRTRSLGALGGREGGVIIALTMVWMAGVFGLVRVSLRPWMVGLILAASAALVRLVPGMTATLIAAFGFLGYTASWRWLRVLGLPAVLAGAWWLKYPLPAGHLAGLIDAAVPLAGVMLLGRVSHDRQESRAAQARALADLQKAHAELQAYAAQVEELSALRERNRLGREMHDTLGHALSAITVQLEATRRVHRRDPGGIEPMLVETQALARQAMQELRQYLAGLRAGSDDQDLPAALQALAGEAANRNGWQLSLDLTQVAVPDQSRQALLQIARESITNIERHAHARMVTVRLWPEGGDIALEIADDGQGFDPEAPVTGHYGLKGMRERLAELDGNLRVESKPGQGSRVIARLPANRD